MDSCEYENEKLQNSSAAFRYNCQGTENLNLREKSDRFWFIPPSSDTHKEYNWGNGHYFHTFLTHTM